MTSINRGVVDVLTAADFIVKFIFENINDLCKHNKIFTEDDCLCRVSQIIGLFFLKTLRRVALQQREEIKESNKLKSLNCEYFH